MSQTFEALLPHLFHQKFAHAACVSVTAVVSNVQAVSECEVVKKDAAQRQWHSVDARTCDGLSDGLARWPPYLPSTALEPFVIAEGGNVDAGVRLLEVALFEVVSMHCQAPTHTRQSVSTFRRALRNVPSWARLSSVDLEELLWYTLTVFVACDWLTSSTDVSKASPQVAAAQATYDMLMTLIKQGSLSMKGIDDFVTKYCYAQTGASYAADGVAPLHTLANSGFVRKLCLAALCCDHAFNADSRVPDIAPAAMIDACVSAIAERRASGNAHLARTLANNETDRATVRRLCKVVCAAVGKATCKKKVANDTVVHKTVRDLIREMHVYPPSNSNNSD
jgi:hypothetical protein